MHAQHILSYHPNIFTMTLIKDEINTQGILEQTQCICMHVIGKKLLLGKKFKKWRRGE